MRSVSRLAQQIHRVARPKGEEEAGQLKDAYAKLIEAAEAGQRQTQQICAVLHEQGEEQAKHPILELRHLLPLVGRARSQATRRAIEGEVAPVGEKLVSLFEPHAQIIVTHKAGKPVQFGNKVMLGEVEEDIINCCETCRSRAQDFPHPKTSMEGHRQRFGRVPYLLA